MTGGISAGEGAIKQGAGVVADTKTQLDSELRNLRGKLAGIGSQWQGAGAAAFTQLMNRWDADATKIISALDEFEQNLRASDTAYVASDDAASTSMGNLQSRLG